MFKTQLIVVLIASQLLWQPGLMAADSYLCKNRLAEVSLLHDAKEKMLQLEPTDLSRMTEIKEAMSLSLGEIRAELLNAHFEERLSDFNKSIEELKACGKVGPCLITKAKKAVLYGTTLLRVISGSMGAEARTQELLSGEIESIADAMAEQAMGSITKEDIAKQVNGALYNRHGDPTPLFQKLLAPYTNIWPSLVTLYERPDAHQSFFKPLGASLLSQAIGQMITQAPLSSVAWGYPNTIVMSATQAGVGAKETPKIDLKVANYRQVLLALPRFIHGKSGFRTDFFNKRNKLFSTIAFEYPLSFALRILNEVIIPSAATVPADLTGWLTLLTSQAVILTSIYAFLSVKWAGLDKWAYINFFPNLIEGTKAEYQKQLHNSLAMNKKTPELANALRAKKLARGFDLGFWAVNELSSGVIVMGIIAGGTSLTPYILYMYDSAESVFTPIFTGIF